MIKVIVYLLDFVALLASMSMGPLAAGGLCAAIWGSSVLDTALGSPPDHAHPAFVTMMAVAIPGMLLGWCGAIAGVILPLHLHFGIPLFKSPGAVARFLQSYASRLIELTNRHA